MLTELALVQLRETAPGVYRLDHAHGEHDDRAVALAMCCAHLLEKPAGSEFVGIGGIGLDGDFHIRREYVSDLDARLTELRTAEEGWRYR